jgi:P-type conjugative transfer protein TrbJ
MLIGQARSLASLPYSALASAAGPGRSRPASCSARPRVWPTTSSDPQAFRHYGAAPLSASDAQLTGRADARWSAAVAGFEDALKVQAGVVGGLGASRDQLTNLVGASQGAVGGLQAAQAGNQLLALQSQQLADLIALNAAQGRAQALEAADRAAARADAKARLAKFLGAPQP